MDNKDLQQISDLMDQKFTDNNKKQTEEILNRVDKKFDDFAIVVKESFDKVDERLDKMDNRLDKMDNRFDKIEEALAQKPSKKEMFSWADNRIHDLEMDMNAVKYIHRDKWDKLPSQLEINADLVKKGIK